MLVFKYRISQTEDLPTVLIDIPPHGKINYYKKLDIFISKSKEGKVYFGSQTPKPDTITALSVASVPVVMHCIAVGSMGEGILTPKRRKSTSNKNIQYPIWTHAFRTKESSSSLYFLRFLIRTNSTRCSHSFQHIEFWRELHFQTLVVVFALHPKAQDILNYFQSSFIETKFSPYFLQFLHMA